MPENIEKYLRHVEKYNMPHERKIEALRVLYYIMKGFVDRAFQVDPTQQSSGLPPVLPVAVAGNRLKSAIISIINQPKENADNASKEDS